MIDIQKLIKDAYQNAVEHGLYACRKCIHSAYEHTIWSDKDNKFIPCDQCDGTGIDKHINIGEVLAVVLCEITAAIRAYKDNMRVDINKLHIDYEVNNNFCTNSFDIFLKILLNLN